MTFIVTRIVSVTLIVVERRSNCNSRWKIHSRSAALEGVPNTTWNLILSLVMLTV